MPQSLTVGLQMDPMADVDIVGDSTFAMALEASRRGHSLFEYQVTDMSFVGGKVRAHGREITVKRVEGDHVTHGPWHQRDLAELDVILMRQDPPFDMQYIAATHLLDLIHPETLVVNDPTSVRNAPEKLFVLEFQEFLPPTLITRNADDVRSFRAEHKDIIVKPLFGNGGAGIFHVQPNDTNLSALIETFQASSRDPFMVQSYLPEIREGDKRILLADGAPIGGINRVPPQGEARANLHVGGTAHATELTTREREICEALGPRLRELGLIFVGIDVIGQYMTEINVTSPTGLQELGRFEGTVGTDRSPEALMWDAIQARL